MHLTLASVSPRRRQLLEAAGVALDVRPSGIDDGRLSMGRCTPAEWVMALAYLKAAATACQPGLGDGTLVVGADTVCVNAGEILGQPRDITDAGRMVRAMAGTTHEVLTGVALIDPAVGRRSIFVDRSVVTVGELSDDQVAGYLETGLWRGKAGAYNIAERLDAGWPIRFEGSMDSIMGLPVARTIDAARRGSACERPSAGG
ncbi:MAG: Maf family protein [Phycisphaerales bacterium]|nr:Maf-like protein [Planctomycetota bacterium]MCH8507913.1 Maf family protein [Phycisphaerales bacterium]